MPSFLLLDAADYNPAWPRFVRTAARAISLNEGKIMLIHSRTHGEYKFPGGGVEAGESIMRALHREVLEELGMRIQPASIRPYAAALELRQDRGSARIFEQRSLYYCCEFTGEPGTPVMTPFERSRGYEPALVELGHAIKVNGALERQKNRPRFLVRDLAVMERLAEAGDL